MVWVPNGAPKRGFLCINARTSGLCGRLVLETLNKLVAINQLQDKLFPLPCSDIGVPEFAANLIIFARDYKNEIDVIGIHISPLKMYPLFYLRISCKGWSVTIGGGAKWGTKRSWKFAPTLNAGGGGGMTSQ